MKMRKIYSAVLALALTLTLAVPSFASEATDIPPATGQEATDPAQQPEGDAPPASTPAPDETTEPVDPVPAPDETTEPVDPAPAPDETTEPVDPAPAPDETVDPADPAEPGGEGEPPAPDGPQTPGGEPGDAPGEDEPAEDPQAPVGEGDPAGEEAPEEAAPQEESPVINVVVPANGQVTINPYRMPVATTYGETTDQIVHEAQELVSYSDFPVLVSAQVMGTLQPERGVYFVSAPPAADAADKEIFLYVEFQNDPTLWSGVYGDWPNQILVTDWDMGKENVMALDAFGVGYFRLFGAMTNFPDAMWGEEDVPNVTVSFTFTAVPGTAALSPEDPSETPEINPETTETAPEINLEGGPTVETAPDAIPEEIPDPVPDFVPDTVPDPAPDPVPEPVPGSVLDPAPGETTESIPDQTVTSDPDTTESAA